MPERIDKTNLATQDIEELAAYFLAEAGIAVALRFIDCVEHAFHQLSLMPKMGALLGFENPAIADVWRWRVQGFSRLLILYRPLPDGIQVIRVIDAARDINALFDSPGFPST